MYELVRYVLYLLENNWQQIGKNKIANDIKSKARKKNFNSTQNHYSFSKIFNVASVLTSLRFCNRYVFNFK